MSKIQFQETPMRLIEGKGLKTITLIFGKGKNQIQRTFSVGKTTLVPGNCVNAALKSNIIEEVLNAK